MKTKQEIVVEIKKTVDATRHALNCGPATTFINAPRALIQLSATTKLDSLYWVLEKERPKFKCDDRTKTNT